MTDEIDRRQYQRRRTDRGTPDRRAVEDIYPLGRGVHIGSVGAAARELGRDARVGRLAWAGEKWLTMAFDTPAGPQLMLHKRGGRSSFWTLGAEDMLANDWVVW